MGDVTLTVKGSGAGNGKEPKTWRLGRSTVAWPNMVILSGNLHIVVESPNYTRLFEMRHYLGVSINGGTPIAGWLMMENPI